MKQTLRRYSFILCIQIVFLIADLFFNSFSYLFYKENLHRTILLFVTQDVLIICQFLLFAYSVHSTCVYQVGASHIILRNCKFFLLIMLTYFLLSATQHFWIVYRCLWAVPAFKKWPAALSVLAMIQRIVSIMYYYTYKRTALSITNPRYNEDNIDWIADQLKENK